MINFSDLSPTHLWIISLWLAALGGCVGSFLNVVVYRLPAGLSIVHPSSRCPKCGHAIRWYDNVPVFGWLWLGGKCRDCHEPIAFRYPLVEAFTAALFVGLAWVELFSDGANLPAREIALSPKVVIAQNYLMGELIGIYAFHLLLLCTLLSAALIEYDQRRVPFRLFAPVLFTGFLALLFMPRLFPGYIDTWLCGPIWGLFLFLFIVMIGLVLGRVLGWTIPRSENRLDNIDLPPAKTLVQYFYNTLFTRWRGRNTAADGILFAMVCVSVAVPGGFVFGVFVLVPTLLNRFIRWTCPGVPFVSPVIWLAVLVPIWIVLWRQLAEMCPLSS